MVNEEIRLSPGAKPRIFYGYVVVVCAFFCMMIVLGLHTSFGVFFKPVLTEFGWTRAMTSGAFSLAMVTHGLLGIAMGGLNDKLGPRIVLSICGLVFGLGFLLMSQISTIWQLYLFYGVIIGAGASGAWVPLMSTVARWFIDKRGLMTGIVLVGYSIGGLTIPPIATHLISTYGWRISYIILGSIALVIVISAAQFLRRDPAQVGQTPYVNNKGREPSLELGTQGLSLKEAVNTREFWVFFSLLFCSGFCMFSVIVHIVPHVTDLGFSPAIASGILATMNGSAIAGRVGLGSTADKIGSKGVFIIGFFLMLGILPWLVSVQEAWQLYLFAIIFGFAHGGLGVVESPLAAELFGLRSHGLIYGVLILGWTTGAAVGPFVTGYIFDVNSSYKMAFLVGAALALLGLLLTSVLRVARRATAKT